jgi:rfaE bifunctional protein kinase chain/domain
VGDDLESRRLLKSFHRGVDRSGVIRAKGFRTPIKTRILAGGVHAARQQVVRIDRESGWPVALEFSAAIIRKISPLLDGCDAVILSDYGSDLVTPALADAVRKAVAKRPRRRAIPVLVDSRYRLLDYRGLTACTPNESEVERVLGVDIDDDGAALERAGRMLLQKTRMNGVLITRGSRGMALFEPKQPTAHISIFGSGEVADVTGAGDTVIATLGLALSAGASLYEAARLANYAGGLVVKKRGTATVSAQELSDAVTSDHDTTVENWSQEGPAQGRRSQT